MAKLPKNLIKKYGISKKAWSVYRAQKKGSGSRTSATQVNNVKRKRRTVSARRRVAAFRAPRRRRSSSGSSLLGGMGKYVAAGLYGAGRQKFAEWITPVTARIPGGSMADEIALFGAALAAKKFVGNKVPYVKDIAEAGMLIEAAAIGEALASGALSSTTRNTGNGAMIVG